MADPLSPLVIQLENSGDQDVSPAGAIGQRQIMPKTAEGLGYTAEDMFDPVKNAAAGDKLLGQLRTQFNGDRDAMLVAYNAGPQWAEKWLSSGRNNAILPGETQKYLAHATSIAGLAGPSPEAPVSAPQPINPEEMPSSIFERARKEAGEAVTAPTATEITNQGNWSQFANLRAQGYSWDDIDGAIDKARAEATAKGYSNADVDKALGLPARDYGTTTEADDKGVISNVWGSLDRAAAWTKETFDKAVGMIEDAKATPYLKGEAPNPVPDIGQAPALDATSAALKKLASLYEAGVNAVSPSFNFNFRPTALGLIEAIGYSLVTAPLVLPDQILRGMGDFAELLDSRKKSREETLSLSFGAGQALLALGGGKALGKVMKGAPAAPAPAAPPVHIGEVLAPDFPTERNLLDASTAVNSARTLDDVQYSVRNDNQGVPVVPRLEGPPAPSHWNEVREGVAQDIQEGRERAAERMGGVNNPTAEEYRNNPAFPALTGPKQLPGRVFKDMATRALSSDALQETARRLMDNYLETGEQPMAAAQRAMGDRDFMGDLTEARTPEQSIQEAVNLQRERGQEFSGNNERVAGYPASSFSDIAARDALNAAGYDTEKLAFPATQAWQSNTELLVENAKRLGEDTSGMFRLSLNDKTPFPMETIPLPIDPKSIGVANPPLASIVMDRLKFAFAPYLRSPPAEVGGLLLREGGARIALLNQQATQMLQQFGRAVGHLSVEERFTYMHALQTGELDAFPEGSALRSLATTYREMADHLWDELNKRDLIESYVENYLSQLWKKPDDVARWMRKTFGAAGNEFFRKPRVFETYQDGMKAGFIPRTSNPIEIMLSGLHGMVRSIETYDVLTRMREQGLGKMAEDFTGGAKEAEEQGLIALDPRIAHLGDKTFYTSEPVAVLFNRMFGRSVFADDPLVSGYRHFQNTMRAFKLSLSFFHPTLVGIDSILTGAGQGWAQISRGILNPLEPRMLAEIPRGVLTFVTAPARPFWTPFYGRRIYNQALGRMDYGEQMQRMVENIVKAGPKFGATAYDYAVPQGDFWGAFKGNLEAATPGKNGIGHATVGQEMKMMWDNAHLGIENNITPALSFLSMVVPRIVLTGTFGMFSHFVPYMKLGSQALLLADQLRVRPGLNDLDTARLSVKNLNAVEDRMGELNMDNTFWNKTFVAVNNLAFNAFSFFLGNVRAVAGGAYELGTGGMKIGGIRELTPRASYLIGAATMLPVLNAAYAYLNGTWNQNWNLSDYYNPEKSSGVHVTLPGIARWVEQYISGPLHEGYNELAMPIHLASEFAQNTEWNNAYIAKPEENMLSKGWSYIEHLAYQFEPMIFDKTGDPATTWLEKEFGIRRAPSGIYPKGGKYQNREQQYRLRQPREED